MTLVFTDIEGSTNLLERIGEGAYVAALAEHRRVLRSAFAEHGGLEVDTQGDAFFYVFAEPRRALAAVTAGQKLLESGPVRVRIGVHTGQVLATEEGYAGREVHRAARIAAAGHGGQIVVSESTKHLVEDDLTPLGNHRLKDFDEPMSLYQAGSGSFPPLRTISNTNLPRPASAFVGRSRERDDLVRLVSGGHRIVTMTGPGGTGKTRLAIEVASELVPRFTGGVFWVPLAALRDPALVRESIARAIGARVAPGDLATDIGEKELLLVVDNLEQVVDAAADLADLAARCGHLALLVTSREVMRVDGETEYAVPPLDSDDAVELFCERTRRAPTAEVAELCSRLDYMPLALEMAAARTSVLSPAQILDRLGQRLDLLKAGRGVDPRQQTLRATIEWSHDLLDEEEQALFARLAVFRGGCTVDTAELIVDADLDVLQSLVDKSLLRHLDERFFMLQTIRQYAWEQLTSRGELPELRRRHATELLAVCEALEARIDDATVDSHVLINQVRDEHDNLRAALEWARDAGEHEALLRLAAVCDLYWDSTHLHDSDYWCSLALERSQEPARARMTMLRKLCMNAAMHGDLERSDALVDEWLQLAEEVGDEHGAVRALNSRAMNALEQGRIEGARLDLEVVRERSEVAGFRDLAAFALINLGELLWVSGDYAEGLRLSLEATEAFQRNRDTAGEALSWENGGWCALVLGKPGQACSYFCRALTGNVSIHGTRHSVTTLSGIAAALVSSGEPEYAARLLGGADTLQEGLPGAFDDEHRERLRDDALHAARTAVGEAVFAAEWAHGSTIGLDGLVALAEAQSARLDDS